MNRELEKIENNNTVIAFFKKAVAQYPNKIAAQCKENTITYKELEQKSDILAQAIQERGVCGGTIILFLEQGIDMIVAMIGVLKTGNAYVPIDPEHPIERVKNIIKDSDATMVVSNYINQYALGKTGSFKANVIYMEELADSIYKPYEQKAVSAQHAIILYTSGSTGKPKGVVQTHFSLFHNIFNYYTTIQMTEYDRIALFTSYSHAVAVIDIFSTLITGGTVQIYNVKEINSLEQMKDWMKNEKITIYHSVPTLFREFLNSTSEEIRFEDVRLVVLGGEAVLKQDFLLFQRHFTKKAKFVNFLGSSEILTATLNIMSFQEELREEFVSVGKPVRGLEILLLDKHGQRVANGEKGEIAYKSPYLAKGYLNRDELNAERFITVSDFGENRVYRSGDIGVFTEKGRLKYLGREDNQIKLRGIRIELGEVESQIEQVEGIDKSIVVFHKEEAFLVAFYETRREELTSEVVRRKLYEKVPLFMIPRYFVRLEHMPLTPLGKIDRKYLEQYKEFMEENYQEPQNEMQKKLCTIWEGVFGKKSIGIRDNYFELGGNSLNAVRLITKLYREFGKQVSVKDILMNETIEKIEEYLKKKEEIQKFRQEERVSYFEELSNVEDKRSYYPLSNAQKRMYALYEMEPEAITYNTPVIYRIKGKVEKEKLERAFQDLIQRHETLRTAFLVHEGEVVQKVEACNTFQMEYCEKEDKDIKQILEQFVRPFNLQKPPLIRAVLIKVDTEQYILAYDIHHIVSDGTSAEIIISELAQHYNNEPMLILEYQFKNYVVWQNKFIESQAYQKQKEFWKGHLSELPVLNFPLDYPRPSVQSFCGSSIFACLENEITADLKKIATLENCTLYMVLLAAFQILLSKYSGQRDIILGTPVAGRNNINLNHMVGMFVNTVVLKNEVRSGITFQSFLRNVRDNALLAYANQDYQFDDLINDLDIVRDSSRNPVFDVMFVMENMDRNEHRFGSAVLENYQMDSGTSKFDMTLIVTEVKEGICLQLEYCTDLFREETAKSILEHYRILLKQISQQPCCKISELSMMSSEEYEKILNGFNATKTEYPREKSVSEVFEEQVKKTPNHIALVHRDSKVTYYELNEKANKVAGILNANGVKENTLVGIVTDNCIEMIAGILGILKAGGAYLPVDPEYPESRIKYMFEDSKANIVIVQRKYAEEMEFVNRVLLLEEICECEMEECPMQGIQSPDNLAYIIYTSGTTGKPKGVMVEQRGITRLVKNTNYVEIKETDRILQSASIVFDATTFEFWAPLLNGACLYISDKDIILNTERLAVYLKENKITAMWLTSALFNQLCSINSDMFGVLNTLLVGGDIISPKFINEVRNKFKHLQVVNGYGPTENTTFSLCCRIEKDYAYNIPIGKPISNSQAYILGEEDSLLPIGAVGELCVAGDGLARGYLNHEELTKEKFVDNPFRKGTKMYRTGDLARWMPDGNVEFLGRRDKQIKIRGFRIEIGEIESKLNQIVGIKEAVVQDFESVNKHKYLCTYFVADVEISINEIREELSKSLPDYMIPAYFVRLEILPVTTNGKLDRKKLPRPETQREIGRDFVPPQNEIQEGLVKAFCSVLDVEIVSIHDNFYELGGDSIKAIQVSDFLRRQGIKINTRDIIKYAVLERISQHAVIQKRKSETENIVTGVVKPSPIQRWFYDREQEYYSCFFNSYLLHSQEPIEEKNVKQVFDALTKHHDMLRMKCEWGNGNIIQKISSSNKGSYNLQIYDLTAEADVENKMKHIVADMQQNMDLMRDALVQLSIFKTKEGYFLSISIHHLLMDGISWRILLEDFLFGYKKCLENEKIKFQEKTSSFIDWTEHLNAYANSSRSLEYLPYWLALLERAHKIQDEKEKTSTGKVKDGIDFVCMFSKEETKELLQSERRIVSFEINAFLLNALGYAYKALTGKHEILIDLESHGREELFSDINVNRTVGWFTSVYPICISSEIEDAYENIQKIQEQLDAVPNGGVDYLIFKYLVDDEAVWKKDFQIQPEIGFNYLGQFGKGFKNNLFALMDSSGGINMNLEAERMHQLEISGIVMGEQLTFTFNYNSKQYSSDFISKLVNAFQSVLIEMMQRNKEEARKEQQQRLQKREFMLENMSGFNEVFYRDCLYNQAFAIINYYKSDIRCILADDVFVYELEEGTMPHLVPYTYSTLGLETVVTKIGIQVQTEIECTEVIPRIETALRNNHPVLLLVDLFYIDTRPDMYQKKHWSHVLMIYGFNSDKKEFTVIDHSGINNLDYKETIILYKTVETAYRAYFDTFNKQRNLTTYYEFINSSELIEELSAKDWQKMYRDNMFLHKDDIYKHLGNLERYVEAVMEKAAVYEDLEYFAGKLIDEILDLIKYKNSEKYAVTQIFDNSGSVATLKDAVIMSWDSIRTMFERSIMKSNFSLDILKKGIDKISAIYEKEEKYYDALFAFLDNII